MKKDSQILRLVKRLNSAISELTEPGVIRTSPRGYVVQDLKEAFQIIDIISALECDYNLEDIKHESKWLNWKYRKDKSTEFMIWLKRHGVETDNFGFELSDDHSGYRVVTRKSLKNNKNVFRIPSAIIFSREMPYEHEEIKLKDFAKTSNRISSEDKVIRDLLTEMSLGKNSFFKPYLDVIRPVKFFQHPMAFCNADLVKIQKFDNLFCESALVLFRFWTDYCKFYMEYSAKILKENESATWKDIAKYLTYRKYLWACLTVDIYSTTVLRMDANGILLSSKTCLVPLLDMCEFEYHQAPLWNLKYSEGDVDDYVCSTTERVTPGKYITRQYSDPRTLFCFKDYGFVPFWGTSSELDAYRMSLDLGSPDDDSEPKTRRLVIAESLGFAEQELFDIQIGDITNFDVEPRKVMRRLFLYCHLIRGNSDLLDLIERGDSDLTFLTKPTRMTWYFIAVQLRQREHSFLDNLFQHYANIEKQKSKLNKGLMQSTRDKMIGAYLINEYICLHFIGEAVKKQISSLPPDSLSSTDKYDSDEYALRKEYDATMADILNVQLVQDQLLGVSIKTGTLTLTAAPPK